MKIETSYSGVTLIPEDDYDKANLALTHEGLSEEDKTDRPGKSAAAWLRESDGALVIPIER